MLYAVTIFVLLFVYIHPMADGMAKKYKVDASVIKWLFYYHYFLWIAYYLYAQFNPSDSIKYFQIVSEGVDDGWLYFYGTSTIFIRFLAFPLVNFLGFTYEAIMILFAFFGYMGIVYLYIFFKENLIFQHKAYGYDVLLILFFLPNTHFWTVSLGKGSVIMLGIGLFFYAISRAGKRIVPLILGIAIIYHVRSHILLVILIATFVGFVSGSGRFTAFQKFVLTTLAVVVFLNIYKEVLQSTGLDVDILEEGTTLSTRAMELSKATSGIPIQNYSVPMQLFTFWFRPFFFDAPGILGLIVSLENLIALSIAIMLMGWKFPGFLLKSDPLVKTSILTFLLASYPLAQISGNLGIALRQKSMVMLLLYFSLLVYQDKIKWKKYYNEIRTKKLRNHKAGLSVATEKNESS